MTDYVEATDAIYSRFATAWAAQAANVIAHGTTPLGYTPDVAYDGAADTDLASGTQIWARAFMRSTSGKQTTVSAATTDGAHVHEDKGLLFIQLYLPRADNGAMSVGRKLAQIALDAFRANSNAGDVWYTNTYIAPRAGETRWNRLDVVTEYTYYSST